MKTPDRTAAGSAEGVQLSAGERTGIQLRRRRRVSGQGIGRPLPAGLVHAIYEETEGNPFYVSEVFRHLTDERKIFLHGDDGRPI